MYSHRFVLHCCTFRSIKPIPYVYGKPCKCRKPLLIRSEVALETIRPVPAMQWTSMGEGSACLVSRRLVRATGHVYNSSGTFSFADGWPEKIVEKACHLQWRTDKIATGPAQRGTALIPYREFEHAVLLRIIYVPYRHHESSIML